ncbi:polysaccharide deacetylase family protein [Deinococcus cellulosilyticus]|uniref:NodB homology domain-containing protein n=1 Tax=Deinococcus cellulosilyticus (strain DSM 18568 / NBRC 106333 / KACC 11606 / 5516J-15) TaxID=1223518 RepID=A0A511NAU6_DEIC1|nr:polysaccharide deacetylase family protein [Deinococcus cellulosilyticus]GEM49959.1 hypothetical protein DC3_55940 [Deinococcus cellulosilyticus NBRC 106333 = KACC 11606]
MIKLKKALMAALATLSLGSLSAQAESFVLVYHRIGVSGGLTLGLSPEALQKQVLELKDQGYSFILASQVKSCTGRCVIVTIDDGYEDVYTQAFPALKELGIPATFFVITEKVGTEGFVTWEQLKEMQAAGWEIQSHTASHARLIDLPPAEIRAELQKSKDTLEANLGTPVPCVAYPYGLHDARIRKITAEVYGCGFGTLFGLNSNSTDELAYYRPFSSPLDDMGILPFRAQTGLDHTALFMLLPLADWQLGTPVNTRDSSLNPAPYTLLGDMEYHLDVGWGQRQHTLKYRSHDFSVQADLHRGIQSYNEITASYHLEPITLGVGYGNGGVVLGASANLLDYGEAYGYYMPSTADYGFGAELLPLPYLRLKTSYGSKDGLMGSAEYALPFTEGEGRPFRINLDYDHQKWMVGGSAFLGSFKFKVSSDFRTTAKVSFSALW